MSSSQSLCRLRDDPENDFDQLPLRSLNPRSSKPPIPRNNPSASSSASSPLKKSRKKTTETVYDPSRITYKYIESLASLLYIPTLGYGVTVPFSTVGLSILLGTP